MRAEGNGEQPPHYFYTFGVHLGMGRWSSSESDVLAISPLLGITISYIDIWTGSGKECIEGLGEAGPPTTRAFKDRAAQAPCPLGMRASQPSHRPCITAPDDGGQLVDLLYSVQGAIPQRVITAGGKSNLPDAGRTDTYTRCYGTNRENLHQIISKDV